VSALESSLILVVTALAMANLDGEILSGRT
jgi:hypothetical protein